MSEIRNYDEAVTAIKTAILQSQYDAAKTVNEKQLMLYYGIGKYISLNSRKGFWGKGAIDAISERLDKELPGLRGFTPRNLRYMRTFYEEWALLDSADSRLLIGADAPTIWNLQIPKLTQPAFLQFGTREFRIRPPFPWKRFCALVSRIIALFWEKRRIMPNDYTISSVALTSILQSTP